MVIALVVTLYFAVVGFLFGCFCLPLFGLL